MRKFLTHSVCFLIIVFISLSIAAQSQDKKITLSTTELSGLKILNALKEQSGYRLNYSSVIETKLDKILKIDSRQITVKEGLQLLKKYFGINYRIDGEYITLSLSPSGALSVPNAEAATGSGSLKGRIVEFETSQPLPGATVRITELNRITAADNNGYYRFSNVRAGHYTLQVSFVGYADERMEVDVKTGKEEVYDVKLQGSNTLSSVTVSSSNKIHKPVAHTSEKQVLEEVKKSSVVVSAISSEQIGKSADRNAAEAVQKISGVTVVDDKFVIVRGLNQRYNLTYLNDNVAPSTEVYGRAFALDLIPSRIIDRILVYKSPAPENLADATGGVVKIYTKDARNVKHFDMEFQAGYRAGTTFNNNFLTYKGGKYDFLGFDDGTRKLPSSVPGYNQLALANLTPSQYAKTFNPTLTYQKTKAIPNMQLTANYYNSFKVWGKTISVLSSLSYKNEVLKTNIYRQQGYPQVSFNSSDKTYMDDRNTQTAQLNLLQNFTLRLRDSSSISFKNFLLQQGVNNTIVRLSHATGTAAYFGLTMNKDNILSFTQRFLYAGNIGGTHYFGHGKQRVQWNGGYTFSRQSTPDQRVIRLTSYYAIGDTSIQWRARGLNPAFVDDNYTIPLKLGIISRLWMQNSEGNYNASADYTYTLTSWLVVRAGTFHQWKERKLYRRIYTVHEGDMADLSGRIGSSGTPSFPGQNWWIDPQLVRFREQDLPEVWSEKYLRDDYTGLRVADRTTGSDSYLGTEQNNSAYMALQFTPANRKIEVYGGLRYEYNRQKIGAAIPASANVPGSINYPIYVDNPMETWLPSVNVSWRPTDSWVVRTAYGKTVNRTEFREVAPYKELDYENNVVIEGNTQLKSATVDNYDCRIEFYPNKNKNGEMFSAGVFYKKLIHPIERINNSPRSNDADFPTISFQNAASATIQGLEIEIHKKLGFIPLRLFRDISFIGNVSFIKSETRNDTTVIASLALTPDKRPLQGQPPYIVNAGLYYENAGWGTKFSVVYNTSGTNIYAAGRGYIYNSYIKGPEYRGSILELPRHTLDMAITQRIIKGLQLKFSVQNLLDQEIRMAEDFNFSNKYEPLHIVPGSSPVQWEGDNIASKYKPGRYFLLNLSYSF